MQNKKEFDITALGELLIDFTPQKSEGNPLFEANPGGAPCNVLAAAQKLGKKTAFIGKVGKDAFGTFLKNTVESIGINTDCLYMSEEYFTTLAFVTLDENGDRDFSFARNNSADVNLCENEVSEDLICKSKIFHCGTLSLTHEQCRKSTIKALECAKANGVTISVDPNLREPLWKNLDDAKSAMKTVLEYADIIKISDYELDFLYKEKDVEKAAKMLVDEYNPKIVFATCGSDGAYMLAGGKTYFHPCFKVNAIDTTGAGDAFCGTALSMLTDEDILSLTDEKCEEIVKYASAAAGIVTTRRGAICSMPSDEEIAELMKK